MLQHAMHAGIRHDPHEVQLRPPGPHPLHGSLPDRIGDQAFFQEKLVQADQFLVDHASRPDVLMPDLAVSHHAVGEAHVQPARTDERGGVLRMEHVIARLAGLDRGVVGILLRVGILPPTIANYEQDGLAGCGHNRN